MNAGGKVQSASQSFPLSGKMSEVQLFGALLVTETHEPLPEEWIKAHLIFTAIHWWPQAAWFRLLSNEILPLAPVRTSGQRATTASWHVEQRH